MPNAIPCSQKKLSKIAKLLLIREVKILNICLFINLLKMNP